MQCTCYNYVGLLLVYKSVSTRYIRVSTTRRLAVAEGRIKVAVAEDPPAGWRQKKGKGGGGKAREATLLLLAQTRTFTNFGCLLDEGPCLTDLVGFRAS